MTVILDYRVERLHFGCRACLGRNLAEMELCVVISSIFRRYDIQLETPAEKVRTSSAMLGYCTFLRSIALISHSMLIPIARNPRGFSSEAFEVQSNTDEQRNFKQGGLIHQTPCIKQGLVVSKLV